MNSLLAKIWLPLKVTSDEAISLHKLINECFSRLLSNPFYCKFSARRLLRRWDNSQLTKLQMHFKRKLAMTSMVMV